MHSISSNLILRQMVTVGAELRALRLLGHYANEVIFHGLELSGLNSNQSMG
jgi:hypothetical protein